MKRSEFLKIIARLGLAMPVITSQTFPEYIAFNEVFYDADAEALIKRVEENREVYDNEKIAIRYWFREIKEHNIFDKLDSFYPLAGPADTARINWINPDPRYDLKA